MLKRKRFTKKGKKLKRKKKKKHRNVVFNIDDYEDIKMNA